MKTTSMTLRLRISRTKRRLSELRWFLPMAFIAILGLLFFLMSAMRALTLSHSYGIVRGDIPVLAVPVRDLADHKYVEKPVYTLTEHTTAIIFKPNGDLIFGDLKAFSRDFHELRNKFLVAQKDNHPQFGLLLETLKKWQKQRKEQLNINADPVVVLLPAAAVPVELIMKAMHFLRQSDVFDRVILAHELL